MTKTWWTTSTAALLLGSFLISGSAFAIPYGEWRNIQIDRIEAAQSRGAIDRREAKQMEWKVNHVDRDRFSNNWDQWNGNYWQNHPQAWRYREQGQWVNGHYEGYPYQNDTLDDLRDLLGRLF